MALVVCPKAEKVLASSRLPTRGELAEAVAEVRLIQCTFSATGPHQHMARADAAAKVLDALLDLVYDPRTGGIQCRDASGRLALRAPLS
jgi:hypothetical protein